MHKQAVLFAVILATAVLAPAQQPASPAAQAASNIPDGTVVKVEAKQSVDTKKAKIGDPVRLEVLEDGKDAQGKTARLPDGQPAVPHKTKLVARITSVKPSTKESKEAKLSLFVNSATLPNGKTVLFPGVVLGPFQVSGLPGGTGIDMGGRGTGVSGSMTSNNSGAPATGTPEVPSGIQGINVKKDPQLGTVLVAPTNFTLDNGTAFYVQYVDPSKHAAEAQPQPGK